MYCKTFIFAMVVVLFWSFCAFTQPSAPDTLWTRIFQDGGITTIGSSIQPTPDNGFMIVGHVMRNHIDSRDVWILKIDADGNRQWSRTLGGNQDDICYNVIHTSDDAYMLVGYTASSGAGGYDGMVIKINDQGEPFWTNTYGSAGDDYLFDIVETPDNGYVMIGQTNSLGAGEDDIWLVKVDEEAQVLWQKTFGGQGEDFGSRVSLTEDGGLIICGTFDQRVDEHNQLISGDILIIKLDSEGRESWSRTYGGAVAETGDGIIQTLDGAYIIVGSTYSFGAGGQDIWLLKISAEGDSLWSATFGTDRDEFPLDLELTKDSGFIIDASVYDGNDLEADVLIIKADSLGHQQWSRLFERRGQDYSENIRQLGDLGYALVGMFNYRAGVFRFAAEQENITGHAYLVDQEFHQGIKVMFQPIGEAGQADSTYTDSTGRYRKLLYEGRYDIIFSCAGYQDSTLSALEILLSDTLPNVTLSLPNRVFGQSGKPVSETGLLSEYPNPFNHATHLTFAVPMTGFVSLSVYSQQGIRVADLVKGVYHAGQYQVWFDGSKMSSGAYFVRLESSYSRQTKKFLLVK